MYCLIIIDMQESFEVHEGMRVTNNCRREIFKAIEDDAHILIVEYEGAGRTLKALTDLLKNNEKANYHYVTKFDDDGSYEVFQAILNLHLPHEKLKITGVHTDCCVYQTTLGLRDYFPKSKIEVISDACDSIWNASSKVNNHYCGISLMSRIDNVSIL